MWWTAFLDSLWSLTLELSPWLLLGLVAAGVVRAVMPLAWVARVLGRPGPGSSLKAAVLGAPLPLCSCSVIPVAVGLRRQGASPGATASFLVSTPQNGVDSVFVSYALLGPFLTVVRPIAGVVSATVVGTLVDLAGDRRESPPADAVERCSTRGTDACATEDITDEPAAESLGRRLVDGVRYALTTLFGDLLLWLVVGLLAAAAVDALAPADLLARYGSGVGAMVAALVVGIPMYVCATSSTPLAAALLAAGVSPGVAVVFLLAGPATNLGTFGIVRRELGGRSAWLFVGAMGVMAIVLGLATDAVAGWFQVSPAAQALHDPGLVPGWLELASLAVLATAAAWTTIRSRRVLGQRLELLESQDPSTECVDHSLSPMGKS